MTTTLANPLTLSHVFPIRLTLTRYDDFHRGHDLHDIMEEFTLHLGDKEVKHREGYAAHGDLVHVFKQYGMEFPLSWHQVWGLATGDSSNPSGLGTFTMEIKDGKVSIMGSPFYSTYTEAVLHRQLSTLHEYLAKYPYSELFDLKFTVTPRPLSIEGEKGHD